MYSANQITNWFRMQAALTPQKLQPMLYYSYAWTLVLYNHDEHHLTYKLFPEKMQAWVNGPIIPTIYYKYQSYHDDPIPQLPYQPQPLKPIITNVLQQVWHVYGQYDALQLTDLIQHETPWQNARQGLSPLERTQRTITDHDLYSYYQQQAQSANK